MTPDSRPVLAPQTLARLQDMGRIACTVNGLTPADDPAREVSRQLSADLNALVEQGFPASWLSIQLGWSPGTVRARLVRYGYLPSRPRPQRPPKPEPRRLAPEDEWNRGIAAARAFYREHGHLNVPGDGTYAGAKLSYWLRNRRRDYRLGRLAPDRVKALEDLGIVWDPRGTAWERGLAAAGAFRQRHGHLRVPAGHVDDGFALGAWLAQQRLRHHNGGIPPQRLAALDALDAGWRAKRRRGRLPKAHTTPEPPAQPPLG